MSCRIFSKTIHLRGFELVQNGNNEIRKEILKTLFLIQRQSPSISKGVYVETHSASAIKAHFTVLRALTLLSAGTFDISEIIQIRKGRGNRQMLTCH